MRNLDKIKTWQLIVFAVAGLFVVFIFWEFWNILKYLLLFVIIAFLFKITQKLIR